MFLFPDRHGKPGNVTLGYDLLEEYIDGSNYFDCIVGRYANRIAGGGFGLNDSAYMIAKNDGENHLHGGIHGFDKVDTPSQSNQLTLYDKKHRLKPFWGFAGCLSQI